MATPGHGAHPQFDHDLVWQRVSVSGSPVPIRIVPNGLISRLEPASSWADLLAQAEDLQNLARNRRDPSFRFTGGARECEVDASQTQLDGREMPPLTEASRDATQALISTIKSDSTSCWEFSGLRSALLGSPTTHAFPVPPALPGEDDVESVAEPFFGLSGASDVMFFLFSVRSSFLQARVVIRDALRAFKRVKSYSVPFVGRVCAQFRLCKFVERDQPLLTIGCAIVCRKNPPF
jgi:hypothetical protein